MLTLNVMNLRTHSILKLIGKKEGKSYIVKNYKITEENNQLKFENLETGEVQFKDVKDFEKELFASVKHLMPKLRNKLPKNR